VSGRFVTIEGIEGAGKTTQAELLAAALERAGWEAVRTREPGGPGRLGQALRDLLKDPEVWRSLELAEIYLYAAARAHHVEALIQPALDRGAAVVCDRYLDSTRAYQGYGRGRPLELIEALHAHPPLERPPDRTVLLKVPPEVGLERSRQRAEDGAPGYDEESLAFFRRVAGGFETIARADPARVRRVEAGLRPQEVHRAVVEAVADLFPGLEPVREGP
jgi:dTMP kinase